MDEETTLDRALNVIIETLENRVMTHGQLKEAVRKAASVSEGTFNKALRLHKEEGTVIHKKQGRQVLYALKHNENLLRGFRREPTQLDVFVLEKTKDLVSDIMYSDGSNEGQLIQRCQKLHSIIRKLEAKRGKMLFPIVKPRRRAKESDGKDGGHSKNAPLDYWLDRFLYIIDQFGIEPYDH